MSEVSELSPANIKALERMRKRLHELYSKYRKPSREDEIEPELDFKYLCCGIEEATKVSSRIMENVLYRVRVIEINPFLRRYATVEFMDILTLLTAHTCEDLGEIFAGEANEWYGEIEEPEPARIDLYSMQGCEVNTIYYPNQLRNDEEEEIKGNKVKFGMSETRSVRSRKSSKTSKFGGFGHRSMSMKNKLKVHQPQPIDWDPHKNDDNSFTEEREKLRK